MKKQIMLFVKTKLNRLRRAKLTQLFFALFILAGIPVGLNLVKLKQTLWSEAANSNTVFPNKWSVSHVCGAYPDRLDEGDFLVYGAQKAYDLGFRGIEVFMSPQNLCTKGAWAISHPKGCYQTYKYCVDQNNGGGVFKSDIPSLKALSQQDDFEILFGMNFRRYMLSVDTVNPLAASQEKLREDIPFTTQELANTYREIKEFAAHLLTTYTGKNKTFLIVSSNELDNRLLAATGCKKPEPECGSCCDCNDSCAVIPALQITKARQYLTQFSKAIHDAISENPNADTKVYHVCEIHDVLSRGMTGKTSTINNVIPNVDCDIIAWSAYETLGSETTLSNVITKITQALDYIAEKTPDHPDFPNGKNVMIGEIGVGENRVNSNWYTKLYRFYDTALDWGVYHLNVWQLFDAQCFINMTDGGNNDCAGLWMVKPNNTLGKVYQHLTDYRYTPGQGSPPIPSAHPNVPPTESPEPPTPQIKNAQFVSQTVPTQMKAGKAYSVEITFKNTGNTIWSSPISWLANDGYYLIDDANPATDRVWHRSLRYIKIPGLKKVQRGENNTFSFEVLAPAVPGNYKFSWIMWFKGEGKFGQASPLKTIKVN